MVVCVILLPMLTAAVELGEDTSRFDESLAGAGTRVGGIVALSLISPTGG